MKRCRELIIFQQANVTIFSWQRPIFNEEGPAATNRQHDYDEHLTDNHLDVNDHFIGAGALHG